MNMIFSSSINRLLAAPAVAGLLISLVSCRPPAPASIGPVQPGETVYFVPNTQRIVALTFDDGPNGAATERILDTLKRFNVPATFFLIGTNVVHYPDLARRIAREGHVIGNHTFSHPRFDRISAGEMSREIAAGADAIAGVTGVKPIWFRPPYGINGRDLEETCHREGYAIAGWSGHAGDWNRHSVVEIAEHMITQATPGDVLLLHDGWETRHDVDRQSTVDAVPLILERLIREGFKFVTLPELRRQAGPPLAEFANGVRLLGLQIPAQPLSPGKGCWARYFWDVPPGWDNLKSKAFVHYTSLDGTIWFQNDHKIPRPGDVRDRVLKHLVIVPQKAPPGRYQVRVGLFNPQIPDLRHRVSVRSEFQQHQDAVIIPDVLDVNQAAKP